jgi:hypothetical protein
VQCIVILDMIKRVFIIGKTRYGVLYSIYFTIFLGYREGLLFIIVINQGFNNILGVANTFPKEKIIVNR